MTRWLGDSNRTTEDEGFNAITNDMGVNKCHRELKDKLENIDVSGEKEIFWQREGLWGRYCEEHENAW